MTRERAISSAVAGIEKPLHRLPPDGQPPRTSVSPSAGGGLQTIQEIDGTLRVASRGEDRAVVVLQHLQPIRDVAGVALAQLKSEVEVGAEKGGTLLPDDIPKCRHQEPRVRPKLRSVDRSRHERGH